VGKQYAQALLDAAQAAGHLKTIHSDMDTLGALLKEDVDLNLLMTNPSISIDKKAALLNQISVSGSFNQISTNFLNLILDKGRIDCIVEMVEAFEGLYFQLKHTQVAVVKSSVALEEEQHFLIAKKIQELTRSKMVTVKRVVDEKLIGGFIVEYGSCQIDLSVRGALDRMRNELKTADM
jgi:F-type H+-transporting ATPase subunit delta